MKNGPYTLIVAPAEYPLKKYRGRYAYEHHVVYWQHFGNVIGEGQEIHHKNGNHRDNRIENLELLSREDHQRHHGRIAMATCRLESKCANCGFRFTLTGAATRSRRKQNTGNRLFCGRSCQVSMQQKERWAKKRA